MVIICRDYEILNIQTIIDNGKRFIAVDIDSKVTVILKSDVVTISPN